MQEAEVNVREKNMEFQREIEDKEEEVMERNMKYTRGKYIDIMRILFDFVRYDLCSWLL